MSPSRIIPVLLFILSLLPVSRLATATGDSLETVIARLDSQIKVNNRDYEAHLQRGRELLEAGRLDDARRDFDTARFSADKKVVAQAHWGLAGYYRMVPKRLQSAMREYRLAYETDPDLELEARYEIAQCGFKQERIYGYNAACEALTRIICIDPTYRDALKLWGKKILTLSIDKMRTACDQVMGSASLGKFNPEQLLYIARILLRMSELDKIPSILEMLEVAAPEYHRSERLLLEAECRLAQDDTLGFEDCYQRSLSFAEQDDDFDHLLHQAEPVLNPTESEKYDSLQTKQEKATFLRKFWKRRDPDPTTPHNERLITHYRRLHKARKEYSDWAANRLANTSLNYFLLTAIMPQYDFDNPYFDAEYDPQIWWDNCRELALQQRGLFYIRHGELDMLFRFGLPWEGGEGPPPKHEAWRYGNNYILFMRDRGLYNAGPNYSQQADITQAMKTETFKDPLPQLRQANYGVDFKGAGGKLEVEFYNSVPVALDTVPLEARRSTVVVYDDQWRELVRRDGVPRKVFTGRDSMWIAVNSVLMDPGPGILAVRMDVPGYRSVVRRMLNTPPYKPDILDMSGFVLGSSPLPDIQVHNRWGINLLPRPSLVFHQGEVITVYVEVYGLSSGPDGNCAFDEQVTVNLDSPMADESIIRRIFGSRKPRTSLTLNFERHPYSGRGPYPEHFTVDTSELAPGDYSLVIGITDRHDKTSAKRGCVFKLVE